MADRHPLNIATDEEDQIEDEDGGSAGNEDVEQEDEGEQRETSQN